MAAAATPYVAWMGATAEEAEVAAAQARAAVAAFEEAFALLDESLRRTGTVADPYQLQAAIAAEHARAASYQSTDWAEIVRLYDLLLSVQPSAPATLARAVAVAESEGAAAGLQALDQLAPDQRWQAVRGELLARQGRFAEAVEATQASFTDSVTAPERRHRERRIAEWSAHIPAQATPPPDRQSHCSTID